MIKSKNANIYFINSIYKITKNFDEFEKIEQLNNLKISKNEITSFQVIINPLIDIDRFDLEINSSVNNIKIFYEHYHFIKEPSTIFVKEDFYPDALIPYDIFKEKKLYKHKQKENLNLLFQIEVEEKFQEKNIELELIIYINGVKNLLNLNIEILPIILPRQIKMKTLFGIFPEMIGNTNDKNLSEYIKQFNEGLNEYKISSNKLENDLREDLYNVIEEIKVKHFNNDVSTICLPYLEIIESNNRKVDIKNLKLLMEKLLNEVIKDNNNYFEKIVIYNTIIDEPDETKFGYVEEFYNDINDIKKYLVDKYKLKGKFKATIENINNIVTVFFREDLYGKVDTWCPTFSAYNMNELIYEGNQLRRRKDKIWWYGCVWPLHPYPNYHIDDDLLNIRVLNYMQFDYDIEGNLYWGVNINKKYNLNEKRYEDFDIWEDSMAFPGANGDGYLFYDGKKYNSLKPFASLRLDSIRNGIYDYQYLFYLDNLLKKMSNKYNIKYNKKNYFENIFEDMYHGTIVNRNYIYFNYLNDFVKNLIILAQEYETYIDFNEKKNSITCYTNKNTIIKTNCDNDIIKNKNYTKYNLNLNDCRHEIIFNIIKDNKQFLFKYYIKKKVDITNLLGENIFDINNTEKETKIINLKLNKKYNFYNYTHLCLDINSFSDVPFALCVSVRDSLNQVCDLGYDIVKPNKKSYFNLAIDFINSIKYSDIESTAICKTFKLNEDKILNMRFNEITEIIIFIEHFKTFSNKKERYNTSYRFNINKIYLKLKKEDLIAR